MIASCHICLAEAAPAISGPAAAATEETRPLTQRLSAFEIWRTAPLASKKTIRMCRVGVTAAPATTRTNGHFIRAAAAAAWGEKNTQHFTGWSAPAFDVARGTVCSHQQQRAVVYLGFAETQ